MGTKNSKQTPAEEQTLDITHSHIHHDRQPDENYQIYEIVPKKAKFNKIDLVQYGKVFDAYVLPQNQTIRSEMESYLTKYGKKWYLEANYRTNFIANFNKSFQFPLRDMLRFCVSYNQSELLEYICTQELIECTYWERPFFLANIFEIIIWSSHLMKLNTLNVVASYMIPERINDEEFKNQIKKAYGATYQPSNYKQFCLDMVEEGMNGRAQRIIQTRKALNDYIEIDFPRELVGMVVAFAFGLCHSKK